MRYRYKILCAFLLCFCTSLSFPQQNIINAIKQSKSSVVLQNGSVSKLVYAFKQRRHYKKICCAFNAIL